MPFLYSVLLIASVFFYILYEHAFSFYLFAFLLVVPIVLLVMTIHLSRRISVCFVNRQNTAGKASKIPIELRVTNSSGLPCPNLMLEIEYSNMLDGKISVMKINTPVYPHESQLMTITISGEHCGTVNFRVKRCKICDALKLFSLKVKNEHREISDRNCTVTILPDYIPLENNISDYSDMGLETDEYSKTQKGDDPSEIFDIRDYIEGDKLNRIHWKLSAKQDKTMVKDYSLPISNSILLMPELVRTQGGYDELEKFDMLIVMTASISSYLLENGVPHRVVFYDDIKNNLIELNITDDESHSTMLGMLLRTQLYSGESKALLSYTSRSENMRCGHLLYISGRYDANATELMNDSELAYKYTYMLMYDNERPSEGLQDEFAQIIPVYPGRLSESVQELCL